MASERVERLSEKYEKAKGKKKGSARDRRELRSTLEYLEAEGTYSRSFTGTDVERAFSIAGRYEKVADALEMTKYLSAILRSKSKRDIMDAISEQEDPAEALRMAKELAGYVGQTPEPFPVDVRKELTKYRKKPL